MGSIIPDLHLHPDLQSKILTYLRSLASKSNLQFIVTTHSPTILDQALDNELYVLNFKSDDPNRNQLKKIATSLDRLEALKQIAGNAYLVTTGRSIICIEGDADATAKPADIRLFQILYPRSTAFTFIPTGGKGEVIRIVKKLREYLPETTFGIKIYGLTDMDQSKDKIDGVYTLPVCMIENLLLNPNGLLNYLQHLEINAFNAPDEVNTELTKIATSLKEDEISYRIMRELGGHTVRLRSNTVEGIKKQLEDELTTVRNLLLSDSELKALVDRVTAEMEQLITNNKTRECFKEKAILETFYKIYLANKNIAYSEFCYELANHIATTGDVEKTLNPIFDLMN